MSPRDQARVNHAGADRLINTILGLFRADDGMRLAVAPLESARFETREAAVEWLRVRGVEPGGEPVG
ncbi:MAG: hypothetical protein HY908_02070 [Myxococcales bacterium]|nr:hypothetical protein [Myxococcales bacterium]